MRWATEPQVADHYKDEDMAADLCDEAARDPQRVRYHKRFPGVEKYKQFHVDRIDEDVRKKTNAHTKRVKGSVGVDANAMAALLPKMGPPPAWPNPLEPRAAH